MLILILVLIIFTLHPQNLVVKISSPKKLKILCNDPVTKHIFPLLPLISFKRMGNALVSVKEERTTGTNENQNRRTLIDETSGGSGNILGGGKVN